MVEYGSKYIFERNGGKEERPACSAILAITALVILLGDLVKRS
jgi:hypothetical protein